jgi:NAD(P) transhydrogenase subunit alpha
MKIAVPKETLKTENRVAASPDVVKKWTKLGLTVCIESGAGEASGFSDKSYTEAGAQIAKTPKDVYDQAHIIVKVQKPQEGKAGELDLMPMGATIVAHFNHSFTEEYLQALSLRKLNVFALERVPRITRAQTMDVLSSQSNLAGYRSVIVGVNALTKALPMMMTAAGTIMPAKVLIVGAGVAGLQAIATAKRLGAVVSAFDVRPAAKEQVESLGAKFIEVAEDASAETAGGYAKEMSEEYKKKQAERLKETLSKSDLVITTALIPGRPAPKIITQEMVEGMPINSVIVDMAAEKGGNCELTKAGEDVNHKGVRIMGPLNLASELAGNASALYAKNMSSFLDLMVSDQDGKAHLNLEVDDEIIRASCVMLSGKVTENERSS